MKIMDPLRQRLQACKGGTRWYEIAEVSGISYSTVARIARGFAPNPRALTVEALFAALDAPRPRRRRVKS
jgi:transcriptional regulator with XRE-family HTH domain